MISLSLSLSLSLQPKYIHALKKAAERRKLEGELVYEHQAQKDIEKDAEEFRDKESFVTSAYKKKLEERRELEEELAREAAMEGRSVANLCKLLLPRSIATTHCFYM